jgi:hypothetical protein
MEARALSAAEIDAEWRKFAAGEPTGCPRMLAKLRTVQPSVMAFGHVHAHQGISGKLWLTSAAGKKWEKQCREGNHSEPEARYRRIAWGRDLSDVAAGVFMPTHQLTAHQADLKQTLFVNAANLNATIPRAQHGLKPGAGGGVQVVQTKREQQGGETRVKHLRPPIIVRVYPGKRGNRRPPEIVQLSENRRFPEE